MKFLTAVLILFPTAILLGQDPLIQDEHTVTVPGNEIYGQPSQVNNIIDPDDRDKAKKKLSKDIEQSLKECRKNLKEKTKPKEKSYEKSIQNELSEKEIKSLGERILGEDPFGITKAVLITDDSGDTIDKLFCTIYFRTTKFATSPIVISHERATAKLLKMTLERMQNKNPAAVRSKEIDAHNEFHRIAGDSPTANLRYVEPIAEDNPDKTIQDILDDAANEALGNIFK